MAQGDLASLADVQGWLGDSAAGDEAILTRLVTAASRFVLGYLGRPTLVSQSWSEIYDGAGLRSLVLRQWPATAIAAVSVDGRAIPASSGATPSPGYVWEAWDGIGAGRPQTLSLLGYRFRAGRQNVAVGYTAGYLVTGEATAIPGSPYQATTLRLWSADAGVSYADGGALSAVAANPATGQYVPPDIVGGAYTFAAGDAGKTVLIAYSYVPDDLRQACIELVGERYRYLSRIGQVSHSLGGQETLSFSQKSMHDFVTALLQPYRRVVQT